MDFIANYWFIWLALMVVCFIYAIINQVQRFNRMNAGIRGHGTQDPFSQVSKGIGILMVVGFVGWGSGILLVIAVVIQLIRYLNG